MTRTPAAPSLSRGAREAFEILLVAVLLAVFARTFLIQVFRIPSPSMEPNLMVGDHVLVNKFVYGPQRYPWEEALLPLRSVRPGEVVVFRFPPEPSQHFIKRCLAGGGQEVRIRDKVVLVDGEPLEESGYVLLSDPRVYPDSPLVEDHYRRRDQLQSLVLGPDRLFCLGDHRDRSHDSRYWGTVPTSLVSGRALLVYASLRPKGQPPADVHGLQRVRWRRLLTVVR